MKPTQRLKISLSKPLQNLLERLADQSDLSRRLQGLEKRLEQLERRPSAVNEAAAGLNGESATALFFTDADEPPSLSDLQQARYEAWQSHFLQHPEQVEAGRTVHEMAALRAATQSPMDDSSIDQQP